MDMPMSFFIGKNEYPLGLIVLTIGMTVFFTLYVESQLHIDVLLHLASCTPDHVWILAWFDL